MKIRKTNLAFWLLVVSHLVHAEVQIQGRLLSETEQPLSSVAIKIADTAVTTDTQGRFQVSLPESDVYQLTLSKTGFYSAVQTFSHFELSNSRAFAEKATKTKPGEPVSVTIPDITLVAKKPKRVMLAFTGDTMMGRRYISPLFGDEPLISAENRLADSKAILQHVRDYLNVADLASTNLETQVFREIPGDAAPKSIAFFSQPETLAALKWAGIDYVTLGNNHSYDYKEPGLKTTMEHLDAIGLGYSGAHLNEPGALAAYETDINGLTLGLLGYNGWEGRATPNQVAGPDKGGAAFGSTDNIIKTVSHQVSPGKVLVVQYHGGYEYSYNPSGLTEQRLKTAIDSGAALAVAHHPHVTQGIELYEGKLIAYSMGNFVFDQYIPVTPYSFILYVWLDDNQFHRAELVPVYIKGYKPTPATGIERFTSMARIRALSEQRNTRIAVSGGHGVITPANKNPEPVEETVKFSVNSKVQPLYLAPWHQSISQVKAPPGVKYRLGVNLMNGSDFESFDLFDSPERAWFYDRKATTVNHYGASGTRSLGLHLQAQKISEIGLQPFRRLFQGDRPTTVTAKIKTPKAAKISFYWQGRRFNQKFLEAREESNKNLIGTATLAADNEWQSVEMEFNSVRYNYPSKGFRSYRVMAQIELLNGEAGKVDIDDFAVIEWQTALATSGKPLHIGPESRQASYIGVDRSIDDTLFVSFGSSN